MPEVFSRDFGVPVPVEGRSDFQAGSWEAVDVIVMNRISYITYVMLRLQYIILYIFKTINNIEYTTVYTILFSLWSQIPNRWKWSSAVNGIAGTGRSQMLMGFSSLFSLLQKRVWVST